MKKRKKYVAIMCAALLAFSSLLQGCGKTETASKNSTKEVLSESSEQHLHFSAIYSFRKIWT